MDGTLGAINLPDNWKFYVGSLAAMLALAGLDFIGALFAKEWAERGRFPMFLLGWISFSILFLVYARILKVAELSTVTIGWIVFLQVGLLVMDAVHYNVQMPKEKWGAIAVILVLQVYLIAAPNTKLGTSDLVVQPAHPLVSSSSTDHLPDPDLQSAVSSYGDKPESRRPGRPLGPNAF